MTLKQLQAWVKTTHYTGHVTDFDCQVCTLRDRFLILLDLACSQEGTLFEVHHAVERLEDETEELEGWCKEAMAKFEAFLKDPDKEIED